MAALIYNEVIIIKLYNLQVDTLKYIAARAREGEDDDDDNVEEPIIRESNANEENKENN